MMSAMDLTERLHALADLVPILEDPDADFGHWDTAPATDGVEHLPWYTFGPAGDAFRAALGRGGWVINGFDWRTWLEGDEGRTLRDGPDAMADATPEQLARLLTAIVRSDRFVEGFDRGRLRVRPPREDRSPRRRADRFICPVGVPGGPSAPFAKLRRQDAGPPAVERAGVRARPPTGSSRRTVGFRCSTGCRGRSGW